ncbi:5'-3' exoribonuclease 3 [Sesamum alatum]|uniref:5'-3' exoribonuclease 3 n=1 Tax=Sesamum alatum TaxID=300844 RepID=A0AAE1Z351_9LAMI|nr:5'-3' exoribonuclease 3 [Sesamum alatum]
MGVPSFYRWLVSKYPKIVSEAVEERRGEVDCPNGVEFDNFYLDMNGIIHPCFHPDDDLFPPTTYEEVFSSMYAYIDRLFNIVRPRKLLYLAIDGVAPRAKMNQQRARRFCSSRDNQIADEMEEKLRQEFEKQGKSVLPKQESQVADSNVITPGTDFMYMLSAKLQSYIRLRRSENPAWGNIKVILSDGNVPGEGEHKIMSFIRAQRSSPGYDPNTRHCLYGLDADLIMLALAAHESHFSIPREEVLSVESRFSPESTLEHSLRKAESEKLASRMEAIFVVNKKQHYQFLNVWVLREYFSCPEKLGYDLERIIDDFIFVCFLAGNDFLPHMPGIEIHEGCLDLLMHVYKKEFQNLGGYLVDMQRAEDKKGGYIKLKRVERYILLLGAYEKIFSKRSELRDRKLRKILAEDKDAKNYEENRADDGRALDVACSSTSGNADDALNNTKELKQKLKDYMRNQSDLFKDGLLGKDKVKFGTPGWRERYYKEKFAAQTPEEAETIRKSVVAKYCEGLCWVLLYYFSGVPSWTWFYPYHYGPLASDVKGLSQTKVRFQKGSPFKPLDQLMGVLPPGSAHALPIAFKGLMIDDNSNIIDFYPTEFETDVDGKRYTWQGKCKLPFIDEERLLTETRKLENELKSFDVINFSDGIKGTIHLKPEELSQADGYDLCLFYVVDQGCQYVPRLLEGVTIPEKTVNEEDILETVLWHEHHGNRLMSHRVQHQRPARADHNLESGARSSAPAVIHKGASSRFTLGRGKAVACSRLARPDDLPKYAVGRLGGELRPGAPAMDGDQVNVTSCGNYGATRCNQPMSVNSKPWRGADNFWPSSGGFSCSSSEDRSLNKPSRAAPAAGWQKNDVERSGQVQPPNQSSSGNTGRGRGRGRARGWIVNRNVN